MELKFAIYCLTSLIAILNPFGAVPVFLSVTADQTREQQRRTVQTTTLAAFCIMFAFMVLGNRILGVFGIGIPAFRAGGGILLLLMGISMLHGATSNVKHTKMEEEESLERDSVAVVPLAIPLLSGPGAISTIILLSDQATTWERTVIVFVCLLLSMVVVYLSFAMAHHIQRLMGRTGLMVFSRIMGLILVAVAVQFIADGLAALLPGLRPGAIPPAAAPHG
jgi:multiple antibiotic resistance protein